MSFFTKMNEKLDAGWKMTDINCSKCKFSILIEPKTQHLYCPKCDLEIKEKVEIKVEKNEDSDEDEQTDKEMKEFFSKPSKSDLLSKKLSEKLL